MRDDIDGMLHDTFRNIEGQTGDEERAGERQSKDARKFFKLLEEGKQELYPGCEIFSKLSFTIRLYLLKSLHGLSNVAFSDLLELIKEAFPFAQEKYDIPEDAKNWIFDSVCTAWRKYKSQLKQKHFEAYANDELRMENRPKDVPASHFKDLLEYWNSDAAKNLYYTLTAAQKIAFGMIHSTLLLNLKSISRIEKS
ncbi:PREDICTED: uncharacterized protein LOC109238697 isoform X2 [Nicotiana attenuata]|uniref:uncharacterized protein LOC109238697 isoform X2 n=1 Tax=Nicotiana attenuata TaxID=49451 RepID=UPI000904CF9A|nr:PREDICTED: uncharacterized protein LOC109238697 isoform X2 [Nicotiana attenuata]